MATSAMVCSHRPGLFFCFYHGYYSATTRSMQIKNILRAYDQYHLWVNSLQCHLLPLVWQLKVNKGLEFGSSQSEWTMPTATFYFTSHYLNLSLYCFCLFSYSYCSRLFLYILQIRDAISRLQYSNACYFVSESVRFRWRSVLQRSSLRSAGLMWGDVIGETDPPWNNLTQASLFFLL